MLGASGPAAYRRPAPPLLIALMDRRVMVFLAVWFGLNILFGLLAGDGVLTANAIAWEAHIGGFLAGLAVFRLFDPIASR